MTESNKNILGLPEGYRYRVEYEGIAHAERQLGALNQHLAHVGATWAPMMGGEVPGTKEIIEMRDKLKDAIHDARCKGPLYKNGDE